MKPTFGKPLLFSAPMVCALLDGRKTQTRRLKGKFSVGDMIYVRETFAPDANVIGTPSQWSAEFIRSTRGTKENPNGLWYNADRLEPKAGHQRGQYRPAIHMPRWASRLTLEVTEVRQQRIQDISLEDAIAEGLGAVTKDGTLIKYGIPDRDTWPGLDDWGWEWCEWDVDPRKAFERLWDQVQSGVNIWACNPVTTALTFEVKRGNLDVLRAAA